VLLYFLYHVLYSIACYNPATGCYVIVTINNFFFSSFVGTPRGQSACQIWSFCLKPFPRYAGGPKIL